MEKWKTAKRLTRNRPLTPEEVARDQDIRRKVQEEFPPLLALWNQLRNRLPTP